MSKVIATAAQRLDRAKRELDDWAIEKTCPRCGTVAEHRAADATVTKKGITVSCPMCQNSIALPEHESGILTCRLNEVKALTALASMAETFRTGVYR